MNPLKLDEIPPPPSPPDGARRWGRIFTSLIFVLLLIGGALALNTGLIPWQMGATAAGGKSVPKYHCPMHPSVVSDRPGTCPICSMDLVPIGSAGDHASDDGPKSGVRGMAVVSIAPETRQIMGLKLGVIEKRHMAREVRTSARIVADETRLWRVTTKIDGWVDKLFVAYTGQEVKKGDPLLTIYSPAIVAAQEEYVLALRERGAGTLAQSSRRRLELLDISAGQIQELARTGQVKKDVTLYAPASGVVTGRDVLAGQKIMAGDPLMVIADLSVVWGEADIYQSDLPYVKTGMPLELSLPYWPGKIFNGKVIFVSPTLDSESRTLRARLEIPNSEALLKPGAYGDAQLYYELGEKLSIPASAVMVGGKHAYAFHDLGDGHLVPAEIKLGARCDDYYELLSGLNEGDKVVTSANFLVDSESNLKAAMDALAGSEPADASGAGLQGQERTGRPKSSQSEEVPPQQYEQILAGYLSIQAALASDDFPKAHDAARALAGLNFAAAQPVSEAPDIATARQQFKPLSSVIISAAHRHGSPFSGKLYQFFCPMALEKQGGDWLQKDKETRNPYFGAAMLKCGDVKEEIAVARNHD